MVLVCLMLAPFKPEPSPGHPLDFRPVFRNRAALGYIFGYGAHCFELYGMRTWIVAFWTFVVARDPGGAPLGPGGGECPGHRCLSLPASVLGNEASIRYGRHRAITVVMLASAAVALAIGFSATLSPLIVLPLVLLYGLTVPGDSGSLTAGMSKSAVPANRGATLALHSTVGFGTSALGAWGTGVVLDAAGGPASGSGWLAAFSLLAVGVLLGPLLLRWSTRSVQSEMSEAAPVLLYGQTRNRKFSRNAAGADPLPSRGATSRRRSRCEHGRQPLSPQR